MKESSFEGGHRGPPHPDVPGWSWWGGPPCPPPCGSELEFLATLSRIRLDSSAVVPSNSAGASHKSNRVPRPSSRSRVGQVRRLTRSLVAPPQPAQRAATADRIGQRGPADRTGSPENDDSDGAVPDPAGKNHGPGGAARCKPGPRCGRFGGESGRRSSGDESPGPIAPIAGARLSMAAHDRGTTRTRIPALLLALAAGTAAEAGWGIPHSPAPGAPGPGPVATALFRPILGGQAARPLMISGYAGEVYGPSPRRANLPTGFGVAVGRPGIRPCGPCGSGR
jgi:hypothetical protein